MTVEITDKGSENFYRQTINAALSYRRLLKRPRAKLRDQFKFYLIYSILCAATVCLLALEGFLWGFQTVFVVLMIILAVLAASCFAVRQSLKNQLRVYLNDTSRSVIEIDDDGVELIKDGEMTVRLNWKTVAFVRDFGEAVCFVPQPASGMIISVNKRYFVQMEELVKAEIIR